MSFLYTVRVIAEIYSFHNTLPRHDALPIPVKRTGLGSQIMASLGLHKLILLTDNPDTRYLGLDAYDLSIVGTRPITQE